MLTAPLAKLEGEFFQGRKKSAVRRGGGRVVAPTPLDGTYGGRQASIKGNLGPSHTPETASDAISW
jgi:hypothetical protein